VRDAIRRRQIRTGGISSLYPSAVSAQNTFGCVGTGNPVRAPFSSPSLELRGRTSAVPGNRVLELRTEVARNRCSASTGIDATDTDAGLLLAKFKEDGRE
jgi:hypothetical protein